MLEVAAGNSLFTVFTPTFNRAGTLPRVYDSLKKQTFRDFEWLIVDDGSSDGTRQLVQKWQAEADFPVRYIYQTNQGKPAAFNRGVLEARGKLFLFIDSDDACVPQALERFRYHWDNIPIDQRDKFSAVTVLCKDQNERLVGTRFPRDIMDSDSVEMFLSGRIQGEKWGFQRTDVLRQYPFPTSPDEKFVPESVVWLALSRKYRTRFVNEVLYVYHIDDGAEDHLSSLNPNVLWGRAFFHQEVLNDFSDRLLQAPVGLLRSAINFSRYSFGMGKNPRLQWKKLRPLRAKALLGVSLPFGFLMYLRDKRHALRDSTSARVAVTQR
jgi:glycosyltransferase involved in cell wall biosynthesis